jgi:hypothetical protein
MTTNHQALQLAAAQLVKAQEQVASLSRMLTYDLTHLHNTLNSLGTALEAAGATYQPIDRPTPDPDGLEALRNVEGSRSEGQALLLSLTNSLHYAEALDKKRGNWVGDMAYTDQGETPGTDYAEKIQAILLRLEMELGVEGGRE